LCTFVKKKKKQDKFEFYRTALFAVSYMAYLLVLDEDDVGQ